jgi:hypothetical protein
MKTICIVPCGNKKIWDKNPKAGPTKAIEVYIGPFAKKCREYAEKFHAGSWCILSAKYGFLFPTNIIPGPYDVSFNKPTKETIKIEELKKQASKNKMKGYDKVVILGGKNYVNIIKQVFPDKKLHTPLSGCKGIGYMMGILNEAILNDKRL